jgi:hypothetical protein
LYPTIFLLNLGGLVSLRDAKPSLDRIGGEYFKTLAGLSFETASISRELKEQAEGLST